MARLVIFARQLLCHGAQYPEYRGVPVLVAS